MTNKILITGSAGFIGCHTAKYFLERGVQVIGLDALTDYYDLDLKRARHAELERFATFSPVIGKIETPGLVKDLITDHSPDIIIHLAAQAGVRYSLDAPRTYLDSNISGTFELLEAVRQTPPRHLLIASSSSVYGANPDMPYTELDATDRPLSFYAATKKASEALAHSYAHLYHIPTTMFRFFTVYGPWGRPDMALFKFTEAMENDRPIDIYNHGNLKRDFTYVDDLVLRLAKLVEHPPTAPISTRDSCSPDAPFRTLNIGTGHPINLMDFVIELEQALGRRANKNLLPMQPGDVPATWASSELLTELIGDLPVTPLQDGIAAFVQWYRAYYAPA